MKKQHDEKDCGAACLLTLVQYLGYHTSLEHLRIISGTTKEGTSLLGLQHAGLELGFEVDAFKMSCSEFGLIKEFSILHVIKEGNQNHFVLCVGKANNRWLIADPAEGVLELSDQELARFWTTETCMTIKHSSALKLPSKKDSFVKSWLIPALQAHRKRLTAIVLLGIIHSILIFCTTIFTEKLVDELLPSGNRQLVLISLVIWSVILMLSIGLAYIRNHSMAIFSRDFNNTLTQRFISKLLLQPKRFFDSKKIGDLLTRLEDTEGIEEHTTKWIEDGLISVFTIIVAFVLLFLYDVNLGLVNLLLTPIVFFLVVRLKSGVLKAQKVSMNQHAENNANYADTFSGIDEIKRGQLDQKFSAYAMKFYHTFRAKVYSADKATIRFGLAIQLSTVFTTIVIITISSLKVTSGVLEIGNMLAIISITTITSNCISNLALTFVDFQESKIAFERMHDLLSQDEEQEVHKSSIEMAETNVLSIQNLTFSYPGQLDLLTNISLVVPQGKLTTLLGESGSGKSTFLDIISTLYTPNSGRVLFNNHSIYKDKLEWRRRIGVVPQDIKIFNASLWENIHLESIGSSEKAAKTKVEQLIHQYGLALILQNLPHGVDTILGENGVKLSGGQRKILGLLRALINGPVILLLDEITSSLDQKHVHKIHAILNDLKKEMPILQITHLPISTTQSDQVYMLKAGKITSGGSPNKFLKDENDSRRKTVKKNALRKLSKERSY
ncbi:MAG: ATP-binding cassette domain-containing protein [Roseivirga sp.]